MGVKTPPASNKPVDRGYLSRVMPGKFKAKAPLHSGGRRPPGPGKNVSPGPK